MHPNPLEKETLWSLKGGKHTFIEFRAFKYNPVWDHKFKFPTGYLEILIMTLLWNIALFQSPADSDAPIEGSECRSPLRKSNLLLRFSCLITYSWQLLPDRFWSLSFWSFEQCWSFKFSNNSQHFLSLNDVSLERGYNLTCHTLVWAYSVPMNSLSDIQPRCEKIRLHVSPADEDKDQHVCLAYKSH